MDRASWRWRFWTAPVASRGSGNPAAVPAHHPPAPTPTLIAWPGVGPGARPIMSLARVSVRGGWTGVGMTAGPVVTGRWAVVPPTAIPGLVFTATTWRPSVTTRARAGPGMTRGPAAGRRGRWWRWRPVPPSLMATAWGRRIAAPASAGGGAAVSRRVLIKDDIDSVTQASMSHIRV